PKRELGRLMACPCPKSPASREGLRWFWRASMPAEWRRPDRSKSRQTTVPIELIAPAARPQVLQAAEGRLSRKGNGALNCFIQHPDVYSSLTIHSETDTLMNS